MQVRVPYPKSLGLAIRRAVHLLLSGQGCFLLFPAPVWLSLNSTAGLACASAACSLRRKIFSGFVFLRDVFSYAALRSFEPPYISAWWLRLFGGVLLAGDPAMPEYGSRDLYGMVSTLPHLEMFPN